MRKPCRFSYPTAIVILLLGITAPQVGWTQTVDLRGKQGIPRDLKKDDPPERSLKTTEPPAPAREEKPKVERAPLGVGPTAGGLPPDDKGAAAVRVMPRPIPRESIESRNHLLSKKARTAFAVASLYRNAP